MEQRQYPRRIRKLIISPHPFFLSCLFLFLMFSPAEGQAGWKAGVSKKIITPQYSMWMAGYAARTEPSQGKIHDLWAKALALEDANGNHSVLVTLDLVGLPKEISDKIRDKIKDELNLDRSQIILNSSHTHSGPVLENALPDIYPLNDKEQEKITNYSTEFISAITTLVEAAFSNLEPVKIYAGNGVSRIAVNRRNNIERQLSIQTELEGPNDFGVPVLKVENASGKILAIAFGYACHPTVLDTTLWSGDYPGFAQIELERSHEGATALFFQGAGADQNPMPRRTIPLARQYGRTLAAAVDRVLEEGMKELSPELKTIYQEIPLGINPSPTRDELTFYIDSIVPDGYQKRWAQRVRDRLDAGEVFPDTYAFPVQVWRLGDQALFSIGGETVSGYAIQLKQIFGDQAFVLGYCNDVVSYIPTALILHEGGYEGCVAQQVYGLTGTWAYDTENQIISHLVSMGREIGIPLPDHKIFEITE
ncbi:MAG: neutral/alkaline non-lysosomal ceramidase N-terminal domain-containing protein [Saprospiraceae bacterium]|nr:neutral/alkaline non-lysosomal ceramidase N-terminal domain-containing protein [Saprospiraceae bacterium]